MNANNKTDWRDTKVLSECMMYMLKNEIMCDVNLIVGYDRTSFKAHKYMLSSRSAVFHTMFEGSLPEKGDIIIPDIDEDTFHDILKYFYTDQITITNDNVREMVYAAEKYMLATVKRECETVLKKTAKSEHATKSLQTAYQYHLSDLQKESIDYIEMNTKECLLSEYALSLSKDCLGLILKSDYLECSETDICQFILNWGKHQCALGKIDPSGRNIREALGTSLCLIRFPDVEMKFFSKEIVSSGLLTDDEMVSIYQSHFGEISKTFSSSPRCPISKRQICTINRYEQISQPMATTGIHSIIFHSDTDLWLKGVIIFLPYVQNNYGSQSSLNMVTNTINIGIKIFDDSNEQKINQNQQMKYGQNYDKVWQIDLSKPLLVNSRRDYTIRMDGMFYPHYYGMNCKESVTDLQSGVTIKFKDSPVSDNGTNVSTGQFAGLYFSV